MEPRAGCRRGRLTPRSSTASSSSPSAQRDTADPCPLQTGRQPPAQSFMCRIACPADRALPAALCPNAPCTGLHPDPERRLTVCPNPTGPKPPRRPPHSPKPHRSTAQPRRKRRPGPWPQAPGGPAILRPLSTPRPATAQTADRPGPGGPGRGAGPQAAGWGFYTGRKSKPRWGRKRRASGNDCNVSTQRQTGGRPLPALPPCSEVLTFVLRQSSHSGP